MTAAEEQQALEAAGKKKRAEMAEAREKRNQEELDSIKKRGFIQLGETGRFHTFVDESGSDEEVDADERPHDPERAAKDAQQYLESNPMMKYPVEVLQRNSRNSSYKEILTVILGVLSKRKDACYIIRGRMISSDT